MGMPFTDEQWSIARGVFSRSFPSSLHYAVATVNPDGSPHVTPIGSVILLDNGNGLFFDAYLGATGRNLQKDNRVCVLAVHSSRLMFLKALVSGRFSAPPAIRLAGVVGDKRPATADEAELFHRRVQRYRALKGHDLLWGNLRFVREVSFETAYPVRAGAMTAGLWPVLHPPTHGDGPHGLLSRWPGRRAGLRLPRPGAGPDRQC